MNKRLYSRQETLLHFYVQDPLANFESLVGNADVKRERLMNLHGSVTELQNNIVKLYLKLEQRFRENGLIRELWNAMAHDVSQQVKSLKALPPSFWNQIKKDEHELLEAAIKSSPHQINENTEDISLHGCFELALRLEEPTIIKTYVPLIRSLRKNLSNPALDFYIMVKAHLARIVRVTESFSGDPILIQRSNMLLHSFEKEIQEPQIVISHLAKKVRAGKPVREKKTAQKKKSVPKSAHPLSKHAKLHHSRTKPLVKKVGLQRRRARR
jgi:hypothetical protein